MPTIPQKDQWQPITWEDAIRDLAKVGNRLVESDSAIACHVYGMGGGTTKLYGEIERISGAEVIWTRFLIPSWLFFLRPFTANLEGLVRVTSPTALTQCFKVIGACGTVTILMGNAAKASALSKSVETVGGWKGIQKLVAEVESVAAQSFILDDSASPSGLLRKIWG